MPRITAQKLWGGLNLGDPTTLEDNEFERLQNFFYNSSKRLQTRRGYTLFGQPIPDATVLLAACDATANFAVSDDGATLATGTAIRGSFSVSFDVDVSVSGTDATTLTYTPAPIDISTAKGYVTFWLYVPSGFNTNLTAVKFRVGSDSSNYYEWTLGTLTEAANNFIVLAYDDATTAGTPVDTAIDYLRLQITYTAAYTDKTGVLLDSIYSYSDTSTKPVTSYFFHQRDDTLATSAFAVSGTNLFLYNETSEYWEVINTGLTEFETATGLTTHRTRWSFAVYKNVVYMCNGIDNYRAWNGTLITEYAGEPQVRYLLYNQDRMYGAGDDSNPNSLYYTASAPADASNLNASTVVVGGDEQGKINGLFAAGQVILAGKDYKIYSIDVANTLALPIDAQEGLHGQRTISNVGNGTLYSIKGDIANLQARNALQGGSALNTEDYTDNLNSLTGLVTPINYNSGCSRYLEDIKNYYYSFDTNDDNLPDSTLVYTSLLEGKAWTQYTLPSIYDYGIYITADGTLKYVFASGSTGQIYEFESGFDDDGVAIEHDLLTKDWDFALPDVWKDFQNVTIFGLSTDFGEINVEVIIDGEIAQTATIDSTFVDITSSPTPIGSSPVGLGAVGGGDISTTDTYPYIVRIPLIGTGGGRKIQIRMYSNTSQMIWTLDKLTIEYNNNTIDIFPTSFIA